MPSISLHLLGPSTLQMIFKSFSTSLSRLHSTSTTSLIFRPTPFRQPSCHLFFSSRQSRFNSNDSRLPRLTLYTGTDCSLCDVAKEVLDQVKKEVSSLFRPSLLFVLSDGLPFVFSITATFRAFALQHQR